VYFYNAAVGIALIQGSYVANDRTVVSSCSWQSCYCVWRNTASLARSQFLKGEK